MCRCKWPACESACGEGRECRGQAAVTRPVLERTSTWKGQETVENTCKNYASQGRAGGTREKSEDGDM